MKNEEKPGWNDLVVFERNICSSYSTAIHIWRHAVEADSTHAPMYWQSTESEAVGGTFAGAPTTVRVGYERCTENVDQKRALLFTVYAQIERHVGNIRAALKKLQQALSA